jgi:dihydroorotase
LAAHCEDEPRIKVNSELARKKYGENVPVSAHCWIRDDESCYISSAKAVDRATKSMTRLHILHLSTAKEMSLFSSGDVKNKMITSEVCVHHLWFDDRDYISKGTLIKWNPAIKTPRDRAALWEALVSDKIDVVATDHAPHTLEEKSDTYFNSPSGGPLVQHSLVAMLEMNRRGYITAEKVVQKMCHAPADLFRIDRRGYIREGYYADLVLIDPNKSWVVGKNNILYKCGWSPFEGAQFSHSVLHTFLNGIHIYDNGNFASEKINSKRLNFLT